MSFLKEYLLTLFFGSYSVAKNCHQNGTMPFHFVVLLLGGQNLLLQLYIGNVLQNFKILPFEIRAHEPVVADLFTHIELFFRSCDSRESEINV